MTQRSTIGENPLDAVIPRMDASNEVGEGSAERVRASSRPTESTRIIKERLTIHLPVDLINRVKNAVYWTPGLTLAELGEVGLGHVVEKLERKRGEVFPMRERELSGGRPLG